MFEKIYTELCPLTSSSDTFSDTFASLDLFLSFYMARKVKYFIASFIEIKALIYPVQSPKYSLVLNLLKSL